MLGLNLGLCLGRRPGGGNPPIITADTNPQLAAADDADTPAGVFTAGAYSSSAGTIASAVATYLVNGSPETSNYDLVAGDTLQVTELVTDSAGNSRTFSTGVVTVTLSAAVAAGELADQTYTQGMGDQTVDASADFTGAVGGSWSVSGAGASIDASGVVTIPTDTLRSAATVTVTYTNPGGATSSAFSVTVEEAATGEVSSLTVDGETFTFSEPTQAGVSLDRIGWVVAKPGLQITSRTTQPATIQDTTGTVTYQINGAELNPPRLDYIVDQGLDERAGGYNPGLNVSFPLDVAAGDTLWCAVGSDHVVDTDDNGIREGVISKHIGLNVVSSAWAATAVSPTLFHWTGRAEQAPFTLDLDAFIDAVEARGPNGLPFDLSFVDIPPLAEVIDRVDRLEPWGKTSANAGSQGYETLTSRGHTPEGTSNYGANLRQVEETAAFHLIGNVATRAEKRRIALALIRNGVQFIDAVKETGLKVRGEGAHSQWQLFPVLTALHALGRADEIAALGVDMGTNPLLQPFLMDQAFLDRLVPHSSLTEPHTWRRRQILDVFTGSDGKTWITVDFYRDASEGDPSRIDFNQLLLTRESDGATAVISAPQSKLYGDHNEDPELFDSKGGDGTQYSFAIDAQPATPFAIGDTVYAETQVPLSVGDVDWIIDPEFPLTYNPSPSATYRGINAFSSMVIYAHALGAVPTAGEWKALVDYVTLSNTTSYPSADFDFPTQFTATLGRDMDQTFWAQHAGHLGLAEAAETLVSPFAVNGAYFRSPTPPPANTTRAVWRARYRLLSDATSGDVLFGQRSSGKLQLDASNALYAGGVEDGAGAYVTWTGAEPGRYATSIGIVQEVEFDLDFDALRARITLNGGVVEDIPFTTSSPFHQTGQDWLVFSFAGTGPNLPADTEVEYVSLTTTTDGVESEVFRIDTKTDTIAEINAHPWLEGGAVAGDPEEPSAPEAFVLGTATFTDPSNIPASTSVVEYETKLAFNTAAGSWEEIFGATSDVRIEANVSSGSLQLRATLVKDSADVTLLSSVLLTEALDYTLGTPITINVKIDWAASEVTVTRDGVAIQTTRFGVTGNGEAPSDRPLNLLSYAGAVRLPADTEVEYVKAWLTTSGARTLRKEISIAAQGSVAGINADPWHVSGSGNVPASA